MPRKSLALLDAAVQQTCGDLISCALQIADRLKGREQDEAAALRKCAIAAQKAWRDRDEFLVRHARKGSK
jgi:hypothetical protein